jgi:hypothetical protein
MELVALGTARLGVREDDAVEHDAAEDALHERLVSSEGRAFRGGTEADDRRHVDILAAFDVPVPAE